MSINLFKSQSFKIIQILIVIVFSVSIFSSTIVNAVEIYPKNNESTINIEGTSESVYAFGQTIISNENVAKDIYAVGSTIQVNGNVGRGLNLAGQTITINSQIVRAGIRAGGQTISISGTSESPIAVGEEVIAIADTIIIENATINNDIYLSARSLKISNSRINGNANLYIENISGDDINEQVEGEVRLQENESQNTNGFSFNSFSPLLFVFGVLLLLSGIVTLSILIIFLKRKSALEILEIKLDNKIFRDILIAFAVPILGTILLIVFTLLPIIGFIPWLLAGIIILFYLLSSVYLPIYTANLLKNSLKLELQVSILAYIVIVANAFLFNIPILNIIFWIVQFLLSMANSGFLLRKSFETFNLALDSVAENKKFEEITEDSTQENIIEEPDEN